MKLVGDYELELSEWDRRQGLAPKLLAQAKKRASMIAVENQNPNLTTNETQFLRGVFAEIQSLVEILEQAGVSHE